MCPKWRNTSSHKKPTTRDRVRNARDGLGGALGGGREVSSVGSGEKEA
jgi:hypothetical protein